MSARGRPRRRTGIRRKSNAPKSAVGRMLQDYHQPALQSLEFASLAAGADRKETIIDNSVEFQNSILKWSKLTIRPFWRANDIASLDQIELVICVLKEDEDDAGATYSLDDQEVIRELRNDKKLLRGPWWYSLPQVVGTGAAFVPAFAGHFKPVVLQDFVMDREDDLAFAFTNVSSSAFTATSQILNFALKGFVRAIK